MRIDVSNTGMDYHARADSGRELDIVSGADKPADDTTMNPMELFATSLGMCIAVMLRNHCDERELDCGEITVGIERSLEPGDPICEKIRVRFEVEGDWDERRKAAFMKVAEACPVHQTLRRCSGVDIEIV